jgi:NAD-dependent deacetylase
LSRLPEELAEQLGGIRRLGVITGAGISAESGIPTYRGIGGVYDDPAKGDELIESLSGHTLARDPDRTWRAIAELAQHSGGAAPNAGHEAIARMEEIVEEFVLLTQNVDDLHLAAGSENVIRVHGSIRAARCLGCEAESTLDAAHLATLEGAPVCPLCGNTLRPGAVLFGEMLPEEVVYRMQAEFSLRPPDAILVVGTSALFPYIVSPVVQASRTGRLTIEVNPERTQLSPVVTRHLAGKAGYYLPLIADALSRS